MGIAFTCPGGDIFDDDLETLIVRSISFNDNAKSPLRSFSFNGLDAKRAIFKAFGSGKLIIEGSLDLDRKEMEISIKSPKASSLNTNGFKKSRFCNLLDKMPQSPPCSSEESKHEAALKLQKVYKSFRTRRQLADCAVLVEQRWWKLLDFALLNSSSISFFHIEKPETAVSRWSRARTRAAKVGKGLSKDEKAQKLALQHWLEAIDPRHRYGHNLHFYYDSWIQCKSNQPFFYWLDVGDGKEANLEEHCPRSKLQQQCIKYLGPQEREAYEVIVEDGKFIYKNSTQILDTSQSPKEVKWIFVLSTTKTLYVGQKKKGVFQHSSFLAGGATSAAGRLVVENGLLKAVWPHSGHYRPTRENFQDFMSFLRENNVDLTDVMLTPVEDDEENNITINVFEEHLNDKNFPEKLDIKERKSRFPKGLRNIEIPERINPFEECKLVGFSNCPFVPRFGRGGQRPKLNLDNIEGNQEKEESSPYMFCKQNLFNEEQGEEEEEIIVPQEWLLCKLNSRDRMGSYQLGKKLSFKWSTGAGPRIGCVRDYPSPMQFRALEQVNLSPQATRTPRWNPSPWILASWCLKPEMRNAINQRKHAVPTTETIQ